MARRIKYYSLREIRRKGKRDGRDWRWKPWRPLPSGWPLWETKNPEPPVDQRELSQYESKLISVAHENLERIGSEWSNEDENLTEEYCNSKAKLKELKDKIEDEKEECKDAIGLLEKAREGFSKYPPRWIPLWFYWLIFGIITTGEGLFNYYVFQLFGQEKEETFIMAVAIILTIPVASKLIGYHHKKSNKTVSDRFWLVLMTVIVVGELIALAILRERFFEASKAIGVSDIPITSTVFALVLIVFNLVIFTGLTYLSYTESRTDPEGYRIAKKAYKDASGAVEKECTDEKMVAEELASVRERFNRAHAARESTFEEYQYMAHKERDAWVTYIRTYRYANINARKDNTLPESFKIDPETLIKIPAAFDSLDWDCPGEEKE